MSTNLAELLIIIGIIILILGVSIILFSRLYSLKRIFKSINKEIIYNNLQRVIESFTSYSPVILRIRIDLKNEISDKIICHIEGHSRREGPRTYDDYGLVFFSDPEADYEYEKECKSGKFYHFKLEPEYENSLSVEIKQDRENKQKSNQNVLLGYIQYEIFKEEKPYIWLFPVGLSFLTIGTVILVAGLK